MVGFNSPAQGPLVEELPVPACCCVPLYLTVKQQQELHVCSSCVSHGLSLCPEKWHQSGEGVIAPAGMNQAWASSWELNAPVAQWVPEVQLWAGSLLRPVLLG